jgi:hypothetical protein
VGYSGWSEYLEKAASSLPSAPAAGSLRKDVAGSSKTSILLEWDKVPDAEVGTSGYLLWMALNTRGSGEYALVLNATNDPERNEFLVKGLLVGSRYRFKLQALNFNGASPLSEEYTFNACLPPAGQPAPYRIDTTTSTVTLGWDEPLDDGGCPITGFAVFRDEADQSIPSVEVNSAADAGVRAIPTLRQLIVTSLPSGSEGQYVRFSVRAFNREGEVDSLAPASILFAAIPSKPPSPPALDSSWSNSTFLQVSIAELGSSATGNSPVQAYGLEVDTGHQERFQEVGQPSMVLSHGLAAERGVTYRLRYRARNSVGWGPYSDVGSVLAASAPSAPPRPRHVSSTGSSISLGFYEAEDDGGSPVTAYELYSSADYQSAAPTFSLVSGYTDSAMAYTLTTAGDGLTSGHTYAFRVVAANSKGSSEPSALLIVAVAQPVAKPAAPARDLALSTRASLAITWAASSATEIPVQGYVLYMAYGLAGDFKMVHNGTINALQRSFVADNLEVGALYQFKVAAVNSNGPSALSDALTVHACVAPSPPPAPTRVSGDATSITVAWEAPEDDGGCPLTGYKLMRDSGLGDTDPIAVEVDPSSVNSKPALTEHTVALTTSETGRYIRFRLVAENLEASSQSQVSRLLLAGLPSKPPALVTHQHAETPYLGLQ